jgi:hypothetical protein
MGDVKINNGSRTRRQFLSLVIYHLMPTITIGRLVTMIQDYLDCTFGNELHDADLQCRIGLIVHGHRQHNSDGQVARQLKAYSMSTDSSV